MCKLKSVEFIRRYKSVGSEGTTYTLSLGKLPVRSLAQFLHNNNDNM